MTVPGPDSTFAFAAHRRLGRTVVLSLALPLDDAGSVVDGGIAAQTRRTLERLGEAARRAGVSLQRAAAVHVHLRDAADFAAMNEAYAPFFAEAPPTRTTVVAPPIDPAALIAISAVLIPDGEPREVVHPDGWQRSKHPYSYAIRSGDTLWLAGLVSRRGRDGAAVEGDVTVQTRAVFDNARELFDAAGFGFADVASARVYLPNTADFAAMNDAYRTAFAGVAPPVRATVVCGLMQPSLQVEITFVAVRDPQRAALGAAGPFPFSQAIAAGGRLFAAGMMGHVPGTPGEPAAETREICRKIGQTLADASLGWSDVGEALIYVTDPRVAAPVLTELAHACGGALPAGTLVQSLLVVPEPTVEIMVTAARSAGTP
jgi:2-iminobutanoate/2-iminopropanoate deaminase